MSKRQRFDLFLVCPPGLERSLADEATELGLAGIKAVAGGVEARGSMLAVWRANLRLRGATRVLLRLAQFRVTHLAQLDKSARGIDWRALLPAGIQTEVEASCRKSRIYHSGAAAERIAHAAADAVGPVTSRDASATIRARIDHDLCTISLDTSGDALHKRGFKQAVGKAPLRETLAALCLRMCKFEGSEPLIDPMCGSGTILIEAAEIAAGLAPGRERQFAFEHFVGFDATAWGDMRRAVEGNDTAHRIFGFDRDRAAVEMASENAKRAGVAHWVHCVAQPISALERPDGPPGLVLVNPPYGARIGDKSKLRALYATFGEVLRTKFSGWRVGLITSEEALARATALPFLPPSPPIPHGALRIKLYRTEAL